MKVNKKRWIPVVILTALLLAASGWLMLPAPEISLADSSELGGVVEEVDAEPSTSGTMQLTVWQFFAPPRCIDWGSTAVSAAVGMILLGLLGAVWRSRRRRLAAVVGAVAGLAAGTMLALFYSRGLEETGGVWVGIFPPEPEIAVDPDAPPRSYRIYITGANDHPQSWDPDTRVEPNLLICRWREEDRALDFIRRLRPQDRILDVTGHSLGGAAAYRIAQKSPHRIERLNTLDAVGLLPPERLFVRRPAAVGQWKNYISNRTLNTRSNYYARFGFIWGALSGAENIYVADGDHSMLGTGLRRCLINRNGRRAYIESKDL